MPKLEASRSSIQYVSLTCLVQIIVSVLKIFIGIALDTDFKYPKSAL